MIFRYEVTVEVERQSGKFASREEIGEAITTALEETSVDLYGLGADGDSEYEALEITIVELDHKSGRLARPWGVAS